MLRCLDLLPVHSKKWNTSVSGKRLIKEDTFKSLTGKLSISLYDCMLVRENDENSHCTFWMLRIQKMSGNENQECKALYKLLIDDENIWFSLEFIIFVDVLVVGFRGKTYMNKSHIILNKM